MRPLLGILPGKVRVASIADPVPGLRVPWARCVLTAFLTALWSLPGHSASVLAPGGERKCLH